MKIGAIIDPHFASSTPASRVDDYPSTMLAKLAACEAVFFDEGVSHVYCTGDMFNSGNISFEYFNKVVDAFAAFRMPVSTVVGNHTGDMKFDRVDTLASTPLGALLRAKKVQHLQHDLIQIGPAGRLAHVWGLDYKCAMPVPTPGDINILVAHHGLGDLWGEKGVEDKDLAGFQIAILGHDHAAYPIEATTTGCVVVRPGSISRGTAGETDRTRIPQVAIIDLEAGTAKYVIIPHRPAEEVFSQQAIQRNELKGAVKDYVKSLSDTAYAQGETVAELVVKYAVEQDVRTRTIQHLTKEGIL